MGTLLDTAISLKPKVFHGVYLAVFYGHIFLDTCTGQFCSSFIPRLNVLGSIVEISIYVFHGHINYLDNKLVIFTVSFFLLYIFWAPFDLYSD